MYDAQYIRELTAARKTIVAQREELTRARRWARAWKAATRSTRELYRVATSGLIYPSDCVVIHRAELDALRAERRVLCDALSNDPGTVAGQTLIEALADIQFERDALRVEVARLREQVELTNKTAE